MVILVQKEWKNKAIFAAILSMLAGLLVSRAFLSTTMMVFIGLTIVHSRIIIQLKQFFRSPLLLGMSFLFFIPLISGLWTSDTQTLWDVLRVKLPLLLLPLAFAGPWQLSQRQWLIVGYCFLGLVAGACCWSIVQYLSNPSAINESYLKAKTLPTPMNDDHVRFSWLVSVAVVSGIMLLQVAKTRIERVLIGTGVIFFVAYLHLLSARSGLMMLYLFILCFLPYIIFQRKKQLLLILGGLLLISIAGWFLFPTLQNRLRYNLYDFSFVRSNSNQSGYSDANRVISIKAGWHTLKENPWGVGAGDIREETNKWYSENTPAIREEDKLYPSNEWLIYGNMAGWPGVVLFTIIVFMPLFKGKGRLRFYWIMFHMMAISGFLIETSLETQFGIFIYAFIGLWWWKWGRDDQNFVFPSDKT